MKPVHIGLMIACSTLVLIQVAELTDSLNQVSGWSPSLLAGPTICVAMLFIVQLVYR